MTEAVYVLDKGPGGRGGPSRSQPVYLCDEAQVRGVVRSGHVRALWIAPSKDAVAWLFTALRESPKRQLGDFVTLAPVPVALETLLLDRFKRVVLPLETVLPLDEFLAVHQREDRAEFCLGGSVDHDLQALVLVLGDLSVLAVPLSDFQPAANGTAPDFHAFSVVDHGRTLRFGGYQASMDAVLYEKDPRHRRRVKKLRAEQDRTLGASLRRLRKQRKLRLEDFGSLAKTVARIEGGQVSRPRRSSLVGIAERLGVGVEEIREY